MRLLCASDVVGALRTFGWPQARIGLLTAALYMDTIETATMALEYNR